MKYKNIVKGKFISRQNRFIAFAEIDGKIEKVHVKNTGRCRELLLPDAEIYLSRSENPERKTLYDLISVYKEGVGLVNIDSQVPNTAVAEWLSSKPDIFSDVEYIKPEFTYGDSRIDFYLEGKNRRILMEVKGCTLERNGVGYFPDAPTERGAKHLRELSRAVSEGFEAYIAFVIAVPSVKTVKPNSETDKNFTEEFYRATEKGVKVLFLSCETEKDGIYISDYTL